MFHVSTGEDICSSVSIPLLTLLLMSAIAATVCLAVNMLCNNILSHLLILLLQLNAKIATASLEVNRLWISISTLPLTLRCLSAKTAIASLEVDRLWISSTGVIAVVINGTEANGRLQMPPQGSVDVCNGLKVLGCRSLHTSLVRGFFIFSYGSNIDAVDGA